MSSYFDLRNLSQDMRQYESIEDVFTVFKNQHLLEKKKGFYQSMLMW